MARIYVRALAGLSALAFAAPAAFAHHMEDGETPRTLLAGLLSGLGHPVIGLDHLCFVLGVGLAAGISGRIISLPIAFAGATLVGVVLHLLAIDLPLVEPVIVLSVILIGALLALKPQTSVAIWAGFAALAGVFHGYAYGEAIIGSEATPLAAYLFGLALIQSVIAIGVAMLVARVCTQDRGARIGGGALAGAGLVFASLLLPAIG